MWHEDRRPCEKWRHRFCACAESKMIVLLFTEMLRWCWSDITTVSTRYWSLKDSAKLLLCSLRRSDMILSRFESKAYLISKEAMQWFIVFCICFHYLIDNVNVVSCCITTPQYCLFFQLSWVKRYTHLIRENFCEMLVYVKRQDMMGLNLAARRLVSKLRRATSVCLSWWKGTRRFGGN